MRRPDSAHDGNASRGRRRRLGGALALSVALLAGGANAQELEIATSVPNLGFPFFVHMQNALSAEAEASWTAARESGATG